MLLIPAYAKVNLCLAVRGRRPDGYHEIDSVVVAIDWHDLVGVAAAPAPATTVRLRVCGDGAAALDEDNLASRAAHAVAAVAGPLRAELWLDKRVPIAAGLGGGSADAAGVLRACAALARDGRLGGGAPEALTADALPAIAAGLGSDVPVLLEPGAHRVRGRGERVERLGTPELHLAVAIAGSSSTAATYAAVRGPDLEGAERPEEVAAALTAGLPVPAAAMGSGLEAAAIRAGPVLGERLRSLRAVTPGVAWHLTGSGGAAFAVAASASEAAALAGWARASGFPARACRTVSG